MKPGFAPTAVNINHDVVASIKLLAVVKYDAKCVTHPASNTAYAVPKIDAICASYTLNGPIVYCEGDRITLAQRDHLGSALHARTLLR